MQKKGQDEQEGLQSTQMEPRTDRTLCRECGKPHNKILKGSPKYCSECLRERRRLRCIEYRKTHEPKPKVYKPKILKPKVQKEKPVRLVKTSSPRRYEPRGYKKCSECPRGFFDFTPGQKATRCEICEARAFFKRKHIRAMINRL